MHRLDTHVSKLNIATLKNMNGLHPVTGRWEKSWQLKLKKMVGFTSWFENTASGKIRTFKHTFSILASEAPGFNNASKSRIACCLCCFAEFHICLTKWMFRFWVCYYGHSLHLMDSKRFSAMTTRIGRMNVSLITLSVYTSLATWCNCSVEHIDVNSG